MNTPRQLEEQLLKIVEQSIFNTVEFNFKKELQSYSENQFTGKLLIQKNFTDDFLLEHYFVLAKNYLACYNNESKSEELYQINFNEIWKLYFDIEMYKGESKENQENDQIYFLFLRCQQKFHLIYCENINEYRAWIDQLKSKCVLSNFSCFYDKKLKIGRNLYQFRQIADQKEFMVRVLNIQQLKSTPNSEKVIAQLKKEIIIQQNFTHQNMIQLHEIYEGKQSLYFIYEKLEQQTIKYLQQQSISKNKLKQITRYKEQTQNSLAQSDKEDSNLMQPDNNILESLFNQILKEQIKQI